MLILLTIFGFNYRTLNATEALSYTAGTYEGIGAGHNGEVIVEVSFDESSITDVIIKDHAESEGVAEPAIERIPMEIVEHQSLGIDVVGGATVTSTAIIEAVAAAVEAAGGDVQALKDKEVIKETSDETVEKSAEVVIVGAGGAGMAAAVSAAEEGASVIVLEKTASSGGNTKISGGQSNYAYEPVYTQQEMNPTQLDTVKSYITIESDDELVKEWQAELEEEVTEYEAAGSPHLFDSLALHKLQTYFGGDALADTELINTLIDNSIDTFERLEEYGIEWADEARAVAGSTWTRAYSSTKYTSGFGFIDTFHNQIEENNLPVEIIYEVTVDELLHDGERVVGVHGTGLNGENYTIEAEKGVILATGGFGANVEMRQMYNDMNDENPWPNLDESVPTTNAPSITGDGIIMAEELGANLVGMEQIQLLPFADPDTGLIDNYVGESVTLWVNQEGERFVNEAGRRDDLSVAIFAQTGGYTYTVNTQTQVDKQAVDGVTIMGKEIDGLIEDGYVIYGETLEEVAEKAEIPHETLQATVDEYNIIVETGDDSEFGRTVFNPDSELLEGPWYLTKRAPAVHHTMGGVQIDTDTHVIDTEGNIIPGLYAAGEVVGGIHGANRLGGNAITDVLTYGYIAGKVVISE